MGRDSPLGESIILSVSTLRIDLHVHTRHSPDGMDGPVEVVRRARARGLDGVAITDHDRSGGYRELVAAGLADPSGAAVDGFLVIPGVEASCAEGHLLVLGATFDVPGMPAAREIVRRAHGRGALAVAPHAFDRCRHGLGQSVCEALELDAVETFNAKTLDRSSNAAAATYAQQRGLPSVGGSDAHSASGVGRAWTQVDASELSVAAVLTAVRAGRCAPAGELMSAAEVGISLARGWLTRPWLFDMAGRWAGRCARRSVGAVRRRRVSVGELAVET